MNAHVDVAAYALGAMDDREASQFEDHLVGCSTCATELESMVKVVALMGDVTLADVTGEAPVGPYTAATGIPIGGNPTVQPPAQPQAPPQLPPVPAAGGPAEPFGEPRETYPEPYGDQYGDQYRGKYGGQYGGPVLVPGSEDRREDRPRRDDRRAAAVSPPTGPTPISRRRKGSGRRSVLLAAAAAVVGAVGGGAVVAETGYFQEQPATSARPDDSRADGVTGLQTGGETLSNTDKKTGAHVDAQLVSRPWGTNVAFRVTKIKGPKECRLVAVRRGGQTEVLSTWTVPDGGYGFAQRPQPLALVAATSLQADELTQLKVQEIEPGGDASTLVTLRV